MECGILSVGAMLLGAKSVTGVDIEEASIEVSMENAKRNRIDEGNFHLHCGNVLSDEKLADEIAKKQYDGRRSEYRGRCRHSHELAV